MSRASMFIAALSGAVVALALVAQATDFGSGFVAFALLLLPVVFFLGARHDRTARRDHLGGRGLDAGDDRIRNAYPELPPELEPYFVTSRYDDDPGVLQSMLATRGPMSRMQPFIAIPGMVAVLGSVVAGAAAGIAWPQPRAGSRRLARRRRDRVPADDRADRAVGLADNRVAARPPRRALSPARPPRRLTLRTRRSILRGWLRAPSQLRSRSSRMR
ncbi:MAG: hypothetical protein H0V94_03160 [Actinobacteria bacterium]|nr:hypothetical protein [Actinomycetota bacterium]